MTDGARAELIDLLRDSYWSTPAECDLSAEWAIVADAVLAHSDVVLRALGGCHEGPSRYLPDGSPSVRQRWSFPNDRTGVGAAYRLLVFRCTCGYEADDTDNLRQVQPDGRFACPLCDDGDLSVYPAVVKAGTSPRQPSGTGGMWGDGL